MKNIKKIGFLFVIIMMLVISFAMSTTVYGRDNLAFAAGTTNGINTVQDVNDAMNAYANAGYRRYSYIDPSRNTLWSYLYADVQFFPTHGSLTSISFINSGIRVGNDSGNYIGTNSVNWNYDTILVTYASCEGAGTNGNFSDSSITYRTALKGSDVAVGFKNSVGDGSVRNWAKRYNDKLGSGSGVQDAVTHANSYIYVDSRVKQTHIVHHGNANMKIGRFRSAFAPIDERNILKDSITLKNSNSTSLMSLLKEIDTNFNENNYVIYESEFTSTNVNNNETKTIEKYIDVQLKVGDFYTEAGYTIKMVDDKVTAIYDNNIDKEKQERVLDNVQNFKINSKDINLDEYKSKAFNALEQGYYDTNIIVQNDDIETLYYYDIAADTKHIIVTVPSIAENGDIAYNCIQYKI